MNTDRRNLLLQASAAAVLAPIASAGSSQAAPSGQASASPFAPATGPRSRTILVNDLSGDPDGVFAAAHQLLSTGPIPSCRFMSPSAAA